MALHDSLTDLPNRTLFNDRLEQAILTAQRGKSRFAVMLMDINNFKVINNSMGHLVGDIILKEISTRLLEITRGGDTVARMGGDEFLFLLTDAKHNEQIEFIKRVTAILETPFIVGNKSFEISASIGLALFPDDGDDPETLLRSADVAMYSAKSTAETYKRYDKRLDASNVNRMELSNSLRSAVDNNQFMLHYQPIANYSTGKIDSAEALIRWNHPERGLLYPDNFIPLAEQTFHIGAITQWVLKTALQDLASWNKKGLETGVSINISAQDLLDPALSAKIKTELESNNISASQVTIEITESSLMMHTHQTLKNLKKLRNIGVKIHIDDFGTGYSSLQYLKKFPVTGLKIDKAFVMNMTSDDNDAIIVRSTADLAHNMGLTVVAEGIEKQDIYDVVEILGCDYAQGYLIAKPMSAAALVAWLQKWKTVNHRSGIRASVL
jgi:diguanylate cyclase (GGDEF)-like protein